MSKSAQTEPLNQATSSIQDVVNAAIFADLTDHQFLLNTLAHIRGGERSLIVSDNPGFLRQTKALMRLSCVEIGLDRDQISAQDLLDALQRWVSPVGKSKDEADRCLIVDMTWVSQKVQGPAKIEAWAEVVAQMNVLFRMNILCVYNRELMVDEVLQVVFRAHRHFAAPSGLYENPFWVPANIRAAPLADQMSFVLGRVVPDFEGQRFFEREDRFAARGTDPDWLAKPEKVIIASQQPERWQIYCLGQLRVFRNGKDLIDWKIKGAAAKKTRALFAYLLTHAERGAHIDRIAELLWFKGGTEENKRARLHHTVAMLRKTLGRKESVLRTGDFYSLNPPEGSWIDIASFEQLCRRGVSLFKRGQREEAQLIYSTAEKLYTGDLFEDIPFDYVDNELEDWCLPRRTWLREVALKLQRDFSVLLREQGRLRAALAHCQKGLAIDPTSEEVNIEAMRVFHAQGRTDAVARQYRQYKKALENIGSTSEDTSAHRTFIALTRR